MENKPSILLLETIRESKTVKVSLMRMLSILLMSVLYLTACSAPIPRPVSGTSIPKSVQSTSKLESILAKHAAILVESWRHGDHDTAREQWQAMLWLQPEEKPFSRYLIPPLEPDELSEMVPVLEGVELEAETESGHPMISPVHLRSPAVDEKTIHALSREEWLKQEIITILREFGESGNVTLPDEFVSQVARFVHRFSDPGDLSPWFRRSLARMDKYYPLVHGIFSEKRLPERFYYLALVESSFNPSARSKAGAVGLWQFMPATARQYGLKVTRRNDHRRDPRLSSIAAREYLLDLIMDFGDGHSMLLAMAAYNAGEGRIRSLLRKLDNFHDRNFWTLSQKKLLPKETRSYIPMILAAAVMGENRQRFALNETTRKPDVASLTFYQPISIPYLQQRSGVELSELVKLNPDLDEEGVVTPSGGRFDLVLPASVAAKIKNDPLLVAAMRVPENHAEPRKKNASPSAERVKDWKTKSPPDQAERYLAYKVMSGNTLSGISVWSGVPERKIVHDNPHIAKRGLYRGDTLYLRGIPDDLSLFRHVVQGGDTLSGIARLYDVPQSWLQGWNGTDSLHPQEGMQLLVYSRGEKGTQNGLPMPVSERKKALQPKPSPSPQPAVGGVPGIRFTVQPRNTFGSIATAFGIDIQTLRSANRNSGRLLRAGTQLTIPVTGWEKLYHTVRPRQVLADIADRYGSSARALMTYNGLRNSRIYVDEELIIYRRR